MFQQIASLTIALFLLMNILGTSKAFAQKVPENEKPVRVAMTAAFVSERGVGIYKELIQYLEKETGMPMKFVSNLSYSTVNELIVNGVVDMAFVCGLPYVLMSESPNPKISLLAAPVMASALYHDKPIYYSYIITHTDNPSKSFAQLKGKTFVYNDTISNSGYNMPRKKLIDIGETNGFFSNVIHSGSHEESIRMVASKAASASAVDSLVFDYAKQTGESYTNNVKIIDVLGPAGIPPIIHSKSLSPDKVNKLKKALFNMEHTAKGREILKKALLKKFVPVTDQNYDSIRVMLKQSRTQQYSEIK